MQERAANCAVVVLCLLGATTGTDREVEPAVGEWFVVMFEEQFARCVERTRFHGACPTRVVAGAEMAGMAIRLPAGVTLRITRAGEYRPATGGSISRLRRSTASTP